MSSSRSKLTGRGKGDGHTDEEDVDVGLFLAEPGSAGFAAAKALYYARRPVVSGQQILHFVPNKTPRFVGIDPYNIWIDRNFGDNTVAVSAQ
ncbi:MAG: hypothetical protein ACREHV_02810 [Rhizomicrobium sp.]